VYWRLLWRDTACGASSKNGDSNPGVAYHCRRHSIEWSLAKQFDNLFPRAVNRQAMRS
jgi:hypothetical protein